MSDFSLVSFTNSVNFGHGSTYQAMVGLAEVTSIRMGDGYVTIHIEGRRTLVPLSNIDYAVLNEHNPF